VTRRATLVIHGHDGCGRGGNQRLEKITVMMTLWLPSAESDVIIMRLLKERVS
jgi:hypothetical protein